jgi:hypothetical protein
MIVGTYATPIVFQESSAHPILLNLPANAKSAVFLAQVGDRNGAVLSAARIYATQTNLSGVPASVSMARIAQDQTRNNFCGCPATPVVVTGTWTGETLTAGRFTVTAQHNDVSGGALQTHGFIAAYDIYGQKFMWLQTIQSLTNGKQVQINNVIARANSDVTVIGTLEAGVRVKFGLGAVTCTERAVDVRIQKGLPAPPTCVPSNGGIRTPNPCKQRLTDCGQEFDQPSDHNSFFVARYSWDLGVVQWIIRADEVTDSTASTTGAAVDVDGALRVYATGNYAPTMPIYNANTLYIPKDESRVNAATGAFVFRTKNKKSNCC